MFAFACEADVVDSPSIHGNSRDIFAGNFRAFGEAGLHALQNPNDVPTKTRVARNGTVRKPMDGVDVRLVFVPAKQGDTTTLRSDVYCHESRPPRRRVYGN